MEQRQRACRARIEEAFQQAEAHYGRSLKRVPINFSNHQKRVAGTAHYRFNFVEDQYVGTEIRLSNALLRLNGEDFIGRTPGHEAAHIIAAEVYGELKHGRAWKEVMGVIGQPAERCHRMKTPTRNTFRYVSTGGVELQLTKVRHNKIQFKGATYTIRNGGVLNKSCYAPVRQATNVVVPTHTPSKPSKPKVSKADTVKASIAKLKGAGATLDSVLSNTQVVQAIAIEAGLTQGLCRTYLKNNWRKV